MKQFIIACVALLASAQFSPCRAVTASNLSSFGGIEEPQTIYHPGSNSFTDDSYVNITDEGSGRFKMLLRFHANDWWDGDRTTTSDDRGRAEVKVLGPRQATGETYEYGTTWRVSPGTTIGSRFYHITQVKAYDGSDTGTPLITTTLRTGHNMGVEYHSASGDDGTARSWTWADSTWTRSVIRLKVGSTADCMVQVSVNGDSFTGVTGKKIYRNGASVYQPKWGLYRGQDNNTPYGAADYIEHENCTAIKGTTNPSGAAAPTFSPAGGSFSSPQSVTIGTTTAGASIRYTTDGSTPTATVGIAYTGPITVSSSSTVRAVAYGTGLATSSVSSATFTITSTQQPLSFEAESLARTTSGVSATTDTDAAASGGARVTLNATNTGSWFEFTLPNVPAGTYSLKLAYKTNANRGQMSSRVNGTVVGGTIDQYAATSSYPTATIATVTFSTTGNQVVRFQVTGKNSASSSYTLSADKFILTPQ